MILIINTLDDKQSIRTLEERLKAGNYHYEIVHTADMEIKNCIGCNYCWLKTPGECTIKDDYEMILKKIIKADQMWVVADTHFGFISYKGKNILDRIMPIVTMNLHMKNGQMRHVMRYKKKTDFGVIYQGDGDKEYLNRWAERVAINFASRSQGAYSIDETEDIANAFGNY